MAELLDMSGPEIASELGLPINTVYSRLRLARGQLERKLGALQLAVADRRAHDQPPARAAQRAWLVLLPGLRDASTATGLGLFAGARAAVAGTLLLVGSAVVLATTRPRAPLTSTPAVTTPTPIAPTSAPPPAPPPPRDRRTEEVALLDQAHARLGLGDLAGALAAIDQHTREFADGALIDVREAARVQALCLAGDPQGARAVATRLLVAHPRSVVAQRHEKFVCPR